jgi:alpha-N-arabinofuranosidase
MNMLLENAAFVPVSDMTGLLEFAGIHKRRGRVYVTPQYWTLWLYSNLAGDTPVTTRTTVREYDVRGGVNRVPEISHVPWLDVLATRDSRTGNLILFVVNRDWRRAVPAAIRFRRFNPASHGVIHTLTGASVLEGNDDAHPDRVHPITSGFEISGTAFRYNYPSRSLTVMVLRPK